MGLLVVREVREKGGRKGHARGGGDKSVGILSCNFFWIVLDFWWVGFLSFCFVWLRMRFG